MSGSEIVAVGAVVLVALLAGAFGATLRSLARSLADLRSALETFVIESEELVDEMRRATRHAAAQVDRVDRLVTAADGLESRISGAGRLAQRTFQSPVVKAMAIGSGVSRASQRLRTGTDLSNTRKRSRRRAS